MSAMGFYAVDPLRGNYVFGTPIFDKVSVDLGAGKQFVIGAQRSFSSAKYIQEIHLNGNNYEKIWFTHRDLVAGPIHIEDERRDKQQLRKSTKPGSSVGFFIRC
jgi:putative alpha-1,2-mannosidase